MTRARSGAVRKRQIQPSMPPICPTDHRGAGYLAENLGLHSHMPVSPAGLVCRAHGRSVFETEAECGQLRPLIAFRNDSRSPEGATVVTFYKRLVRRRGHAVRYPTYVRSWRFLPTPKPPAGVPWRSLSPCALTALADHGVAP